MKISKQHERGLVAHLKDLTGAGDEAIAAFLADLFGDAITYEDLSTVSLAAVSEAVRGTNLKVPVTRRETIARLRRSTAEAHRHAHLAQLPRRVRRVDAEACGDVVERLAALVRRADRRPVVATHRPLATMRRGFVLCLIAFVLSDSLVSSS
jgi:hypothetical protein